MSEITGWERSRRTHFDEIAAKYDTVRWDYPCELYDDIFAYSGLTKESAALEIGAGTGIATKPFLDRGITVTAVEMGANMSSYIKEKYEGYSNFNVIISTFEDAILDEGTYDLIYAASAFHWVDAEIGCPKVFRLLKKGGTFALFRNNAKTPDGNELYNECQAIYEKHYYSYYTDSKRPMRIPKEEFYKPSGIYHGFRFESMEQYGFADVTMKFYEAEREYGADEYISLLDTYSDHRALPESNRQSLYTGIKEAIMRHGGVQKLDFLYQLYMGRRA